MITMAIMILLVLEPVFFDTRHFLSENTFFLKSLGIVSVRNLVHEIVWESVRLFGPVTHWMVI